MRGMKILVTNDDGYKAAGIHCLVKMLTRFGDVTVVSPKHPQSGMSLAITIGMKPVAAKHIGEMDGADWWYLDATPSCCIKYGIDIIFGGERPDLVVSGINHGSNAAVAALYSGTVGASTEGVINGVKAVAVSLSNLSPDADFSVVEKFFPDILHKILANWPDKAGLAYNINFPDIPAEKILGVKPALMGMGYWKDQFVPYRQFLASGRFEPGSEALAYLDALEEGESAYVILGDFVDCGTDPAIADHKLLKSGWISVVPYCIDNSDKEEFFRLCDII